MLEKTVILEWIQKVSSNQWEKITINFEKLQISLITKDSTIAYLSVKQQNLRTYIGDTLQI
jgi:hypothetical protein